MDKNPFVSSSALVCGMTLSFGLDKLGSVEIEPLGNGMTPPVYGVGMVVDHRLKNFWGWRRIFNLKKQSLELLLHGPKWLSKLVDTNAWF